MFGILPPEFRIKWSVRSRAFFDALVALRDFAVRSRPLIGPQSGLGARQTPGGLVIWNARSGEGRVALTTGSGITAMTGAVPGSGTCTLQDFDGTTLTSSGVSVTVFNMLPVTVGATAATYVQVKRVEGGYYFVDVASCSS